MQRAIAAIMLLVGTMVPAGVAVGDEAQNENCDSNEFINSDLDQSGGVNLLDFATLSLNFTG